MSIVFYDTETTGLETAFDQILQFAAIRTTDALEEVDRFEIRSRLLPYVVPSPGALKVTGQTISDILHPDRPSHYEMVCGMRGWLEERCPSIFLGYNSTRFDENLLRQAFYQCLHPPYLTNTKGSTRADVLPLMQSVAFLSPGTLSIPLDDRGKQTFKLDRLAPANGFAHERAHDALADVEATIHLSNIVRRAKPELWEAFLRFSEKQAVVNFVAEAPAFFILEHLFNRPYPFPVTCVGQSGDGRVFYCLDLRADLAQLRSASDAQLPGLLAKSPKVMRRLKPNAPPFILEIESAPSNAIGMTADEANDRGLALLEDQALCDRLRNACQDAEVEFESSPHVEEQIYEGFWSQADEKRMAKFHGADWTERLQIVNQLEDPRLKWLGRRLLFVERPDLLEQDQHREISVLKARRMLGVHEPAGKWTTLATAMAEVEGLLASGEFAEGSHFHQLRDHFSTMILQAQTILDGQH